MLHSSHGGHQGNRKAPSALAVAGLVIIATLAATGLHWFATALEHLVLKSWFEHSYAMLGLVGFLISVVLSTWVNAHRDEFFMPRERKTQTGKEIRKRGRMALFLSPQRGFTLTRESGAFRLRKAGQQISIPFAGLDLGEVIEAVPADWRWPWQQTLRAIQHHLPRLHFLTVLCSPGADGSAADYALFRELLLSLPIIQKRDVYIAATPDAVVDFENIGALQTTLRALLKDKDPHEVIIDCTGGQKTTSIAAALYTLMFTTPFQYIQTNHPYDPLAYDFVTDFSPPVENPAESLP